MSKAAPNDMGWGSDVAAEMLRKLNIKYLSLNPGASYRGFHDSLVNYLGNGSPQMLLCLHEDHVVSIAHGYAKVTDEPMACVLHSNVGLMHGLMGIFNAWCDRMPILALGATGPVAADKRRPWIDWIHTAKDQGALLRDFTKWDDEPRSAEAIVGSMLKAYQMSTTAPFGPVYVCLDAGLQEQKLDRSVSIPEPGRFRAPPAPSASHEQVAELADLIAAAKTPLFLFGRGSRSQEAWDRRVSLVEHTGAAVLTSIRERSVFPTDHPQHAIPPSYWLNPKAKELVKGSDLIISFDWVDLNGLLLQISKKTEDTVAKVAHVSLDHALHNGWSMDYFSLPPVDVPVSSDPDVLISQLLPVLQKSFTKRPATRSAGKSTLAPAEYSAKAATEIMPRDVEVALEKIRGSRKFSMAHTTIGWAGDVYAFRDPLDFLGHDGGAGLAAGPGITVGVSLAMKDSRRPVISVLGDGDFMQGVSALWTAAHYSLPALYIVSNNRSNFNDELHQEAVAKIRSRPVENRWIGQRIDQPQLDFAGLARAQGVEAEGPVKNVPDLEAAILRGLKIVEQGRPYLIDAHVVPGYATPPLARGE
ncbi:MAG: thiamine pyrophosphate-binding protein [Alphaproteobacteria bacterium]|nr:thiamine pyrophosphate-binding protein [Alphaproteobacteria bacterium]